MIGLAPIWYILRVAGAFLKTRLGVIPSAWTGNRGFTKVSSCPKPFESWFQSPQIAIEKHGFGFQTKIAPARQGHIYWIDSPELTEAPTAGAGVLVRALGYNPVSLHA